MKEGLVLFYTDPYLAAPAAGSMDICWLTSEPSDHSYVEYGISQDYGSVLDAATYEIDGMRTVDGNGNYTVPLKVCQQIAHLTGLDPAKRYYYRVVSRSGSRRSVSCGFDFKTAPAPGTPVNFLILSDLQLKGQALESLRLAGRQGADFIIYNGDLVAAPYKAGEWFSLPGTPEADGLRLFNMMQQTGGNCRLMQYIPIFPCPGNHEITDQSLFNDRHLVDRNKMDLKVYMQLFRSYYPEQEYGANGKHWYSAVYGDLHITSLSVSRWFPWKETEQPGWFLFDDVKSGSPQYEWLKGDLEAKAEKYSLVSQHWHMYNRGTDTQVAFTDPVTNPEKPDIIEYPMDKDYLQNDVKPLFDAYGVDAVTFGHSHVYERYIVDGIHYIEAASIGNTYRNENDPYEPHGNMPVVEENRFRSFMVISVDPAKGMVAKGIQASGSPEGIGAVGRIFDTFVIAPPR